MPKRHLLLMHYLLSTVTVKPAKVLHMTLGEIKDLLTNREWSMIVKYKPHENTKLRIVHLSKEDKQRYQDSVDAGVLNNLGLAKIRRGVGPDIIKGIRDSLDIISMD
jgi:hypothetical protein